MLGLFKLKQSSDGGNYELLPLPKDSTLEPSDTRRGSASAAVFVARNRFAVLDKSTCTVHIKDLRNETTKQFKVAGNIVNVWYAGSKNILLTTTTSVVLFDTELRVNVAEIHVAGVRHVVWSSDMNHVALLSKHGFFILIQLLLLPLVDWNRLARYMKL